MHRVLKQYFTALLLVVSVSAIAASNWQVKEREVPVPAGASDQIKAEIAAAAQPDPGVMRAFKPATEEQWRALIAQHGKDQEVSLDELGKRLKVTITRDEIAGVKVHRVMPTELPAENSKRLFIYLHGGAYVFRGGDAGVPEGALIAAFTHIPVISIDYRMPPDHPHPSAVEDVAAVYRQLLKTHTPAAIGMGGTSAGGGLTLAGVHYFKSMELPVPGALYLGTPWADLTKTGDTLYTNDGIDRVLVTYDGLLSAAALLYADGEDLKHPLLSPVYGDFDGFPPTFLVTGTRDLFLSDTVRTHRKLRVAGVLADLNVYEGISHAEYAFVAGSPEWQQTYGELSAFLARHLK
jgi:acetyl esterase/lipase